MRPEKALLTHLTGIVYDKEYGKLLVCMSHYSPASICMVVYEVRYSLFYYLLLVSQCVYCAVHSFDISSLNIQCTEYVCLTCMAIACLYTAYYGKAVDRSMLKDGTSTISRAEWTV